MKNFERNSHCRKCNISKSEGFSSTHKTILGSGGVGTSKTPVGTPKAEARRPYTSHGPMENQGHEVNSNNRSEASEHVQENLLIRQNLHV